ncbi:MAG: hypothetical protein WD595_01160, partial [Waddliaceae bacterium]
MSNKTSKTYLFNLIIYSHSEERRRYFEEMVYPLIEKYPCRILFIEGIMESDSDVCQTFCLAPSPEQEKFLEKSDRMVIRVSKENLS